MGPRASTWVEEWCCQGSGPAPLVGGVVVQSRTVDMRDHLQIVVRASPRPISTGQLRTLQCVHVRPINPMVYRGPYQIHLWEPSS